MGYFRLIFIVVAIVILGIYALLVKLRAGVQALQQTRVETKTKTKVKGPASLSASSIIIIRDNGVTVYDSRELAEASMEWADVVRNPSRRAFDVTGVEFVFTLRTATGNAAPVRALWEGTKPQGVDLKPRSVMPQPGAFQDALIQWLGEKGVEVEKGMHLEKLIVLASLIRHRRPAGGYTEIDHGTSP